MQDTNMMLRAAGAGDLLTTTTGAWIDFGAADVKPLTYIVTCPSTVLGTNPTLDVAIQDSDDGTNATETATIKQITAKGQYFVTAKFNGRYRRAVCTVGGTATPNFGVTTIGVDLAGRHTKF